MSIQEYGPEINKQPETPHQDKDLRSHDVGKTLLANVLPFGDNVRRIFSAELSDCKVELAELDMQVEELRIKHYNRLQDLATCSGADKGEIPYTMPHDDKVALETFNKRQQDLQARVKELQARLDIALVMEIREEEAREWKQRHDIDK